MRSIDKGASCPNDGAEFPFDGAKYPFTFARYPFVGASNPIAGICFRIGQDSDPYNKEMHFEGFSVANDCNR